MSGYNTGSPRGTFPSGFPDFNQKLGNFTYAIQLGDVPKTTDGNFRRVILDINEPNSSALETIVLERLFVFVGGTGNAYINGNEAQFGDFGTLVYSLDGNEDNSLTMTDAFSGSGAFDATIDIPESLFTGLSSTEFFRIFAGFSGANGGFEEFAVRGPGGGDGPGPPGPPPPGRPIPEPSAMLIWLTLGIVLTTVIRRRRRSAQLASHPASV